MSQPTLQEALNEEYIEVSKSVPETVRCLEEQSCERTGKCPVPMPNRMRMLFKCSKQGDIKVTSDFGLFRKWGYFLFPLIFLFYVLCPVYFVRGEVVSKEHKTHVKITPVYKRAHIVARCLLIAFFTGIVLFRALPDVVALFMWGYLKGAGGILSILPYLFSLLIFLTIAVDLVRTTYLYIKTAPQVIVLMKEEVKRRVHNIEYWEN